MANRLQALKSRNLRAFLEGSVAHVLPVFVAGSKAVAVEHLAALCDHFEVRSLPRCRFAHAGHITTDHDLDYLGPIPISAVMICCTKSV